MIYRRSDQHAQRQAVRVPGQPGGQASGRPSKNINVRIYIYIYMCFIYINVYIYIYRKREIGMCNYNILQILWNSILWYIML